MDSKFVVSIAAILISILSLLATLHNNNQSSNVILKNNVYQRMGAYLTAYERLIIEDEKLLNLTEFDEAPSDKKRRTEIVFGLLINTIEAMHDAEDPRYEKWVSFIGGIRGPLIRQDIRTWASNEHVIKDLARQKDLVLNNK